MNILNRITKNNRALQSAKHPIFVELQLWCSKNNRDTFVPLRLALLVASAVALAGFQMPWFFAPLAFGALVALSLLLFPVFGPKNFLMIKRLKVVPDELVRTLAHSTLVDAQTKADLAGRGAKRGWLLFDDLREVIALEDDERMRAERAAAPGLCALKAFAEASVPRAAVAARSDQYSGARDRD